MSKLLTMLVIAPLSLFAQKGYFSIGADGAESRSILKGLKGPGMGGSASYQLPINKSFTITGTVGIMNFSAATNSGAGFSDVNPIRQLPTISKTFAVPVQIGTKFYLSQMNVVLKGWFVTAEAGVIVVTRKENGDFAVERSDNRINTAYAAGFGYQTLHWEITYKQQFIGAPEGGESGYGNLRLSYLFRKAE